MTKRIAYGLLFSAVAIAPALSETMKAGDVARAPFVCHKADDMREFGILVEGRLNGQVADEELVEAGNALILAGRCAFFPAQIGIEAIAQVTGDTGLQVEEVWSAKLPDGTTWYFLHKGTAA